MGNPVLVDWLWLIPAFPLLGAIINGTVGRTIFRKFGEKPIHLVSIAMPFLSCLVATWYVFQLYLLPSDSRFMLNELYNWIFILYVDNHGWHIGSTSGIGPGF